MTSTFVYGGPRGLRRLVTATLFALVVLAPAGRAEDVEDTVTIHLDEARIARLPDRVATVVVGNPLIADVSVQQGGLIVLTGKGYGTTNLIALDRAGIVLTQQFIQVEGPTDHVVVVYRGITRESYSCTPRCERRITLGDSPEFFNTTLGQTGTRNAVAVNSAAAQR